MRREPFEAFVARRVEEQAPVLQEEHAVGDGERPLGALLREDDGGAGALDLCEEARGGVGIELRRRLVEQHEPRPHRQGGGQADPLELPARELVRPPSGQMGGAERVERGVHARPDLLRRRTEVLEPEGDVVAHERHEDLVLGILEDGRDRSREVGRARRARVAAADLDPTREPPAVEVRHEPGERADERRLPRARRAEQRDDLARLERHGHVGQGGRSDVRIRERQVLDAR